MTHDLFFEIGVEEIPARFLKTAMADLKKLFTQKLEGERLAFDEIITTATPRRLVGFAKNVSERQSDEVLERVGPAWQAAFDEEGKPTKAAAGFAKSQGADPGELIKIETDKGPRAGIRKNIEGRAAKDIVGPMLAALFNEIPWPKSMRWERELQKFVRPVQWLLVLLGEEVVDMSFAGVAAGALTYGHRFHNPEAICITSQYDYSEKISKARVVVSYDRRRQNIVRGIHEAAKSVGGVFDENDTEKLIDEVTGLTEWPVIHIGAIPDKYMDLPKAVLMTSMAGHQKYFNILRPDSDELLPKFVAVSGTQVTDKELVTKGYERVLNARLADAKFFWDEDLKTPLENLADKLDGVIFHRKLGSYKDKMNRVQAIGSALAQKTAPENSENVSLALKLAKADLLTNMVGEFPELQGIMGCEYAKKQGKDDAVAHAIREHYMPRFAGDDLPESDAGAICSVADKMDSIVAGIGVGLAPTGGGDPYALRRQALGVIQILRDRSWKIDMAELIDKCIEAAKDVIKLDKTELKRQALEFFRLRLSNLLKQEGYRSEIVDGVAAVRFSDVVEVVSRVDAVSKFAKSGDYEAFAAALKRVANIIGDHVGTDVSESLLEDNEEKQLFEAYSGIRSKAEELLSSGQYLETLELIASIRPVVDAFFDSVLVMAKDENVRCNRLSLLHNVASMFSNIADFRKM